MTQSTDHPGLHHRPQHAANGDTRLPQTPANSQHDHSSSSHPADVEAAISSVSQEDARQQPGSSKDTALVPAGQQQQEGGGEEQQEEQYAEVTYADIFKQFSILGWTGFGGPAAHIGLFQRVRVVHT
jgi:hypothetical protein